MRGSKSLQAGSIGPFLLTTFLFVVEYVLNIPRVPVRFSCGAYEDQRVWTYYISLTCRRRRQWEDFASGPFISPHEQEFRPESASTSSTPSSYFDRLKVCHCALCHHHSPTPMYACSASSG